MHSLGHPSYVPFLATLPTFLSNSFSKFFAVLNFIFQPFTHDHLSSLDEKGLKLVVMLRDCRDFLPGFFNCHYSKAVKQ
jgi:hypothetical protein